MNKSRNNKKKLSLSRETIQTLSTQELGQVQGGLPPPNRLHDLLLG
jgi:hypothetical protein